MDWLNYHHLHYFWVVAREGSITKASRELRLAHPTISAQIRKLEESLGEALFERRGRRLVLTEFGHVTYRYAEEIFSLGRELVDTAEKLPAGRPLRLVVGLADVLPKSVVYRFLEPAFRLEREVQVVCREDRSAADFLGELATHNVDVVLSDAPAGPNPTVRVFSHLLGECGTAFFAAPRLAQACQGFPESLQGAPFLMPGRHAALRRALETWFDAVRVRPRVVAEMDDVALAKIAGEAGLGVFAAPSVITDEVCARYGVVKIGERDDIPQRFYAISAERRIRHPAVLAITSAARSEGFA